MLLISKLSRFAPPQNFPQIIQRILPLYCTSDLSYFPTKHIHAHLDGVLFLRITHLQNKFGQGQFRTKPLPQIMAIARNLALNLYREAGFNNMAQAYAERYPLGERKYRFGLEQILTVFRMK
ncbi:MAG: hypothetical protein QNJ18_16195 [Xenococcaceae cyanobacterium MO_167.B52]|nr:hypothetical protein [Xenococcaceae cyanobacterium MO_167.B52]